MLGQGADEQNNPALPLQVETDQTGSSQDVSSDDVASGKNTRLLWMGFGFAVLMLIGLSAHAFLPLVSHVSAKPSRLMPAFYFGSVRALPTVSHPAVYTGPSKAGVGRAHRPRASVRPAPQRGSSVFMQASKSTEQRKTSSHGASTSSIVQAISQDEEMKKQKESQQEDPDEKYEAFLEALPPKIRAKVIEEEMQNTKKSERRGKGDVEEEAEDCVVESPFDAEEEEEANAIANALASSSTLSLTEANVESVLDTLRPFLISDGGNVALKGISKGIVYLELEGACGSCPSSSMTMKMGLERGLMEKIPDVVAVEQVLPSGAAELSEEAINEVLEGVRPFLKMAGGDIQLVDFLASGLQPRCTLRLIGSNKIPSIKIEIVSRLRRKMPSLAGVIWEDDPDQRHKTMSI